MVKVLFAGPSLWECPAIPPGIERHDPARQGDLHAAVEGGASVIGLVDGLFEAVAAVWHKEILYALSQGVHVLGAASLGALRAAECGRFGMIGIGEVARLYAGGELDDDGAVAQLHAPAEFGFQPLTEALVDFEAAIAALRGTGFLDAREAGLLLSAARAAFFKERTFTAVAATAGLSAERGIEIRRAARAAGPGLKQRDALRLVAAMAALPDARAEPPSGWTLAKTEAFRRVFESERPRCAQL
jgi:hypothetical protein